MLRPHWTNSSVQTIIFYIKKQKLETIFLEDNICMNIQGEKEEYQQFYL